MEKKGKFQILDKDMCIFNEAGISFASNAFVLEDK